MSITIKDLLKKREKAEKEDNRPFHIRRKDYKFTTRFTANIPIEISEIIQEIEPVFKKCHKEYYDDFYNNEERVDYVLISGALLSVLETNLPKLKSLIEKRK